MSSVVMTSARAGWSSVLTRFEVVPPHSGSEEPVRLVLHTRRVCMRVNSSDRARGVSVSFISIEGRVLLFLCSNETNHNDTTPQFCGYNT